MCFRTKTAHCVGFRTPHSQVTLLFGLKCATDRRLSQWSFPEDLVRRRERGYLIGKACERLDYILIRKEGFPVYCKHSNLMEIFASKREVKQHMKGKLQRCLLTLVDNRYVVYPITGEQPLGRYNIKLETARVFKGPSPWQLSG